MFFGSFDHHQPVTDYFREPSLVVAELESRFCLVVVVFN